MHDTAYNIGKKFFELYWCASHRTIVEIGALNLNGTLRDHQPENSTYLGLDATAGPAVDLCVDPAEPLPFVDRVFDITIASSVLEHDMFFWETFAEMCRITKLGGYIYVNAPTNGMVHQHPLDCWRFYPDASLALERWGRRRGQPVACVESFVADRRSDQWNDFVAIFALGPPLRREPQNFVHPHFPCRNIRIAGETTLAAFSPVTEDMEIAGTQTEITPSETVAPA